MPNGSKPRIVIIGGGAAGVFTAYLLQKQAKDEFDIKILEKWPAVGGHAHSVEESDGSETVRIDQGAQFFSESAQPDYCDMLREEEFFDVPGLITETDMGITIFHQTDDELIFRVPNTVWKILIAALGDVGNWLCFAAMVLEAKAHFDQGDWNPTFGEWIDELNFWFVPSAHETHFKENILRPLMYQFGLVRPDRLDELSARFVVYYFLASLPKGFDLTPFTVYNCKIGLDGIMEALLAKYDLDLGQVKTGAAVQSVEKQGDHYLITSFDNSTFEADEVVFANNPKQILPVLPTSSDYDDLRTVLDAMEFLDVKVRIQKGDPSYMPSDPDDWSVSNVAIVDTTPQDEDPTNYMMTVWFGPLREQDLGAQFFKSWGSPTLHPENAPSHADRMHQLMVGTPEFIAARTQLWDDFQGVDDLWFVGGYIVDYDSQNASLRSAKLVVDRLLDKHGITPDFPEYLMRTGEAQAVAEGTAHLLEVQIPDSHPLVTAVENTIGLLLPQHPAVRAWKSGPYERSSR